MLRISLCAATGPNTFLQFLDNRLTTPAFASPLINLNLNLDRRVLPAGQTEKAVIKVLLDVPQIADSSLRPPVNLTLVLDRSGSMNAVKLQKAKEAAIAALRRLSEVMVEPGTAGQNRDLVRVNARYENVPTNTASIVTRRRQATSRREYN